ncbi:Ger(x)C family spore germination protein [Paenibacillus sp. CGMCC 1.16610]|uniref:Ger(X)C family spore germination protein n=1 Tax=Paenibacillus anseongense TaxID=2682845 RepID=A0ABW9UKL5_9BACL|nr:MULTISPECIES: Ger(x)C family spore germination protein [Paenibacillus]MBA2941067.1 Ger(x)C family spore germination protein [Paenibacillus sp. CGMCC 1.16610]MVQ39886.1 Ger(x)C family spore germination protein [Paenibacillus anseongense]
MRKIGLFLIILTFLILQTGCWNSKDIQTMAYVTAIGLDYEDGKYITYVQVLNFANVSKTDSSQLGKNIPIWIGKGKGETVTETFNAIYATSQLRVYWGHVKSIVCTERFLKNGKRVKEAYDMINRYREIRYNVLLYGTKESLNDLFQQKSILNLSPTDSLLDNPSQIYSQRSYITPHYGFKIISEINEPGQYAMLPSIALDKEEWTEDKQPRSMFRIDGAYYQKGSQTLGWMSEKEMEGFRWLQEKLSRSPINIPDTKKPVAAIVIIEPKSRILPSIRNDKVYYTIKLKVNAYVDEMVEDISPEDMRKLAENVIEDQLRKTYEIGLSKKIDVLQLGERLYRNYPEKWHELNQRNDFNLDADSLDKVEVKVKLQHTGKYKARAH